MSTDVQAAILEEFGSVRAPIAVIPNGVDTGRYGRDEAARTSVRRELDLPESASLVISVATFKEQKGHRFLVSAAARVIPDHDGTHLILAGDGDLRPAIQHAVEEQGIADRVHFLGDRRDVPRLLAASDVFVLPSLWEGLPMSLLEAMASELPCIATDVSGVREVVADGSGLMVPPANPDALESALRVVLDDQSEAAALGGRARRRVEDHYSAREQARDHVEIYRRGVVGPKPS